MLPTFIINSENQDVCSQEIKKNNDLKLVNTSLFSNSIQNFREAIHWAIHHNEDAVLLVNSGGKLDQLKLDEMIPVVFELAEQQIYTLFLNSEIDAAQVPISENLIYGHKLQQLGAFIVTSPIYQHVLEVLEGADNENLMNAIPRISPYIMVYGQNTFEKRREQRINIIVPYRNASSFITECYYSIKKQNYDNYRVFFVDDFSDDDFSDETISDERVKFIKNNQRKYALRNIVETLTQEEFDADDIICLLDGDDLLAHNYVLQLINAYYLNHNCLVTYGCFRIYKTYHVWGKAYTQQELEMPRESEWKALPLRSFKYIVFEKLKKLDENFAYFKDDADEYYKFTSDMAIMFCLFELVGHPNVFYIDSPLYIYRLHENNDFKINRSLQYDFELMIRQRSPLMTSF